jgi:hypothetical protein
VTPRLTRHPYTRAEILLAGDVFFDVLREPLDSGFGMTAVLMDFLTTHAECAHCRQPATAFEAHMDCGFTIVRGKRKPLPARLRVPEPFASELFDLEMAENAKRWSFLRKLREQSAPGAHTRAEVMVLRQLQEDRCYYCFASLLGPGGHINGPDEPVTCHKDHFTPLRKGGSNNITNIVLACVSCNSSKGERDGMDFQRTRMRKAKAADRAGLKRIHAARKNHSYRLEPAPEYIVLWDPDRIMRSEIVVVGREPAPLDRS